MVCSAFSIAFWSLGRSGHVVDGRLHRVVGQRGVAAFRGHRPLALEGRVVEGFLALRDAWRPRGLVAEFRRAGHTRAMADRARGVERALAIGLAGRGSTT